MSEETITLTERDFPYIIAEPDAPVTSMITITHAPGSEEYYGDERVIFYLANAELQINSDYRSDVSFIKVHHSFGRDEEGDRAYLAYFDVSSVQFIGSYDHTLNFRGWLSKTPKFYPGETPFDGAVQEPEYQDGEEWDGYRNSGYPYLPPKVKVPGLKTPIQVEIRVDFGRTPERMGAWIESIRENKVAVKEARAEAARVALQEKADREAERKRQRELTTIYYDTQPNGEELRTLAAELQDVRGEEKRAFFDEGKYDRLTELRSELYKWLELQDAEESAKVES